MSINSKIFSGTVTVSQNIFLGANNLPDTSFQVTHPNTGTISFSVSNDTSGANVNNPTQMAALGWSDIAIPLDAGGVTYLVDLTQPQFVSPWTASLDCIKAEFMKITITDTGDYKIEQHANSKFTKEE